MRLNLQYRGRNGRAIALILAALLTLMGLAASAESVVSTKKTKVYLAPKAGAPSVSIPAGTVMEQTAEQGGWIRVKRAGVTAYMAAADVDELVSFDQATGYLAQPAPLYKAYGKAAKYGTIPAGAEVTVYAVVGDWACVSCRNYRGFVAKSALTTQKPEEDVQQPETEAEEETPAKPAIQAMDWWTSDIQNIFARGVTATITDVATGISWQEIRKGGTNHADCQPLTAEDTANMKRACGNWSWDRRAVIVTINGPHYAASMNCMPHGGGSVTGNNFDGHHCYHFINSRTSGSDKVDADHQAAIKKALALNAKL